MLERNYIKAAQLARVMTINSILRDTMPGFGDIEEPEWEGIINRVFRWRERLLDMILEEDREPHVWWCPVCRRSFPGTAIDLPPTQVPKCVQCVSQVLVPIPVEVT